MMGIDDLHNVVLVVYWYEVKHYPVIVDIIPMATWNLFCVCGASPCLCFGSPPALRSHLSVDDHPSLSEALHNRFYQILIIVCRSIDGRGYLIGFHLLGGVG